MSVQPVEPERPTTRLPTGSDTEAVPEPVAFEHTGRTLTRKLNEAMQPQGGEPPALTPETLVQLLLDLHTQSQAGDGGGTPPAPPPSNNILGLDKKGLISWLIRGAIAGTAFLVLWYQTVNKELADKPSHNEMQSTVEAAKVEVVQAEHGQHESVEKVLEAHAEQLKKLGDLQIQQTTILSNQAEDLKEIKQDVRYLSNRSRRERRDD